MMELFFIAAFIGFLVAAPIFSRQAQEFLRQRKTLRLALLIGLPTFVFLLVMSLNIYIGIGVGLFYGCMQSNPSEEGSFCNDVAVRAHYQRDALIHTMLPPILRADEICWTVEAGRFCEPNARHREWESYFSLFPLPLTAGLTCFGVLWFFSRDRRKKKIGGESTP